MKGIAKQYLETFPPRNRPALHAIYGAEAEGIRWAVATDGHVMVCHQTDEVFPPMEFDAGVVADCLKQEGEDLGSYAVRDLREFCGPATKPCDECEGTGDVLHDCDCPHCDDRDFMEECDACDGLGTVVPMRPAWFGPLLLNAAVLARALAVMPDDSVVRMRAGDVGEHRFGKAYLSADGVRMLVMGLNSRLRAYSGAMHFPLNQEAAK